MFNVDKHISHWKESSIEDLEVAGQLVKNGKYRHGLFFGHLALEKIIKSYVV